MERATRYSKKREAILTAIRSSDAHPSAEWIYHTLKSTHPDLSLGTVYRQSAVLSAEWNHPKRWRGQRAGALRRRYGPAQSLWFAPPAAQ